MRIREFKNGATVVFDDSQNSQGMITVFGRNPAGEVFDKIRCDNRTSANEYFHAFGKIASKF